MNTDQERADASTIDHEAAASIARGLGSAYTSPSDAAVKLVFAAYLEIVAAREQLMHQLDVAREDRGSALRAYAGLEEVNAALTKERDAERQLTAKGLECLLNRWPLPEELEPTGDTAAWHEVLGQLDNREDRINDLEWAAHQVLAAHPDERLEKLLIEGGKPVETSPVPGLADSGPYTLADVEAIEKHRGKPYARLRETVKERDALEGECIGYRGDVEMYGETLAALTRAGATGHDVQGDALQGIASLVEQRDAARAVAARLRGAFTKYLDTANHAADPAGYPHFLDAKQAVSETSSSEWLAKHDAEVVAQVARERCDTGVESEFCSCGKCRERFGRRVEKCVALKKQLDAAKADVARLREALEIAERYLPEDDGMPETVALIQSTRAALAATDSTEWLAKHDAEVRAPLEKERARLLGLLDTDRVNLSMENAGQEETIDILTEKVAALEAQLVAATNDAARAELRVRQVSDACSAVMGIHCPQPGPECGPCEYARLGLEAAPDSDARLREVMEKVALVSLREGDRQLPDGGGYEQYKAIVPRVVDEVLGAKS